MNDAKEVTQLLSQHFKASHPSPHHRKKCLDAGHDPNAARGKPACTSVLQQQQLQARQQRVERAVQYSSSTSYLCNQRKAEVDQARITQPCHRVKEMRQ